MKRSYWLVLLLLLLVVAGTFGNPERMENKALKQKRADAKVLDQIDNLKILLAPETVDGITSLPEYRAYQKKINRVLEFLLRDAINVDKE